MQGQERAGVGDRTTVRVEVPLGGGDRAMTGDSLQVMDQHTGVGEPSQAGVSKIVAA